jgi:hypothetical protein
MNGRLVFVLAAALVAYAIWAYLHPFRPCPRCRGTGASRLSTARRRGHCWRCKGTREVRTAGSRMLHRAVRSGRAAWSGRKEK